MKLLNAADLLNIWEEGLPLSPAGKTIHLVSRAFGWYDTSLAARLSIGDRDARLLQLREWMFGHTMVNMTRCPACLETVEWETSTHHLHLQQPLPEPAVKTFQLQTDNYTLHFRLPDSNDMMQAMADTNLQADHKKFLALCILDLRKDGEPCLPGTLPETVWERLNNRMAEEDPQADIRMQINCPACAHAWEARFDIGSFLWGEINNWAGRMIQEIGLLARAFGWSENDILHMSARRRQLYLEMI